MGLPSEDPDHIWDAHIANPSHVVDLNGQTLGSFDTCIHNYIVHHVMCELIVFFCLCWGVVAAGPRGEILRTKRRS